MAGCSQCLSTLPADIAAQRTAWSARLPPGGGAAVAGRSQFHWLLSGFSSCRACRQLGTVQFHIRCHRQLNAAPVPPRRPEYVASCNMPCPFKGICIGGQLHRRYDHFIAVGSSALSSAPGPAQRCASSVTSAPAPIDGNAQNIRVHDLCRHIVAAARRLRASSFQFAFAG